MRLDDFEALTPMEFGTIMKAHAEKEDQRLHDGWERTRILTAVIVQLHLNKSLRAEDLLPLPWDKQKSPKTAEKRNPEEQKARFIELVNKLENGQ